MKFKQIAIAFPGRSTVNTSQLNSITAIFINLAEVLNNVYCFNVGAITRLMGIINALKAATFMRAFCANCEPILLQILFFITFVFQLFL